MIGRISGFFHSFRFRWLVATKYTPTLVGPVWLSFKRGMVCSNGRFFAGKGFYLSTNENCRVTIGDKVSFGPDVKILGGNHKVDFSAGHIWDNSEDEPRKCVVQIGHGAWVGANTLILSGAKIGEGCVVGAGSVVTKELPPWTVCAGVPAVAIKRRFTSKAALQQALESTGSSLSLNDVWAGADD